MRSFCIYNIIVGLVIQLAQVDSADKYVVVSNDGPVVLGGSITFKAELFEHDGSRPSGTFSYSWADNALNPHEYETDSTTNTTSYWTISYPREEYSVGKYRVEVLVHKKDVWIVWHVICRELIIIEVTDLLNGNMTLKQSNVTRSDYVSSKNETEISVDIRKGDYDFIANKVNSIATYWFVDCKYYGHSSDFKFNYNFTQPNTTHVVEALVIASYKPPATTTTVAPTTIAPPTTTAPSQNVTLPRSRRDVSIAATPATQLNTNETISPFANVSFPFVCLNTSVVPADPNSTYGYFTQEIKVRAPIANITIEGTNWLQPWELLSLNVSCGGSGPFHTCLLFHRGDYNVTGNETCKESDLRENCSIPILHYFLEPSIYTIVVILNNEVSKEIYPLTINIYKVTTKPQLSVIVVPVSCSLAAVVLIVFGVAYYIQSRARFTVEVADFDFGQHNPELEYKTFTERLRDSFNGSLRPGGDRISGYEPLNKPYSSNSVSREGRQEDK